MTTINLGRVVGEDGEDGRGIVSILKTGTSGLVDTYTITYTDGTTSTFEVTNGQSGGGGGGGISNVAKTMLLTILKKCYTSEDMSAEIDVLEEEFSKTGELTSISVSYTGGDVEVGTLTDTLPIVVTANYSDGTSSRVTTGYTLSPTEISEGTNTITVTYSGKTATFTVTGVEITGELTSITAVCNDQTATVGTSASDLDITVTGHYSDGTSATLSGWTTSGTVQEGTNTFTITYESFTTTITVTGVVGPKVLSSISVTSQANSAVLDAATADLIGVVVTANYSDGTSETLDNTQYTVTPTTITQGTNVLVYSYGNKSTTFNIEGVDRSSLGTSFTVTPHFDTTELPLGYSLTAVTGYYIASYGTGEIFALPITRLNTTYWVQAGTNTYRIPIENKYLNCTFTGVEVQYPILRNADTFWSLYGNMTGTGVIVTDNSKVQIIVGTAHKANAYWDIANAGIDTLTPGQNSINAELADIKTHYTIPAGATVITSIKINSGRNTELFQIFANPTGNTTPANTIKLLEAANGTSGSEFTNTITVADATDINAIFERDAIIGTNFTLDFELSIKVNGVEILGGNQ